MRALAAASTQHRRGAGGAAALKKNKWYGNSNHVRGGRSLGGAGPTCWPLARSQIRAVPSVPAVMIWVPSGVTATARTGPGWPANGGLAGWVDTVMSSSVPALTAASQTA